MSEQPRSHACCSCPKVLESVNLPDGWTFKDIGVVGSKDKVRYLYCERCSSQPPEAKRTNSEIAHQICCNIAERLRTAAYNAIVLSGLGVQMITIEGEPLKIQIEASLDAKDAEAAELLRERDFWKGSYEGSDRMAREFSGVIAELKATCSRMECALHLIAAPIRPDGTWNRSREACQELAKEALKGQDEHTR